jgi:hypothetical protein
LDKREPEGTLILVGMNMNKVRKIQKEEVFVANKQHRFPTAALLVLVVGLVVVVAIILVSFSPILYGTRSVNSLDQAKQLANQYLGTSSDLSIKEIMEFSNNFYVIVQEKNTGVNAFELLVDRYSGRVMPEHGPNMMWNTKYGMMNGMMGRFQGTPTADMPISAQDASEYAQMWLDANNPGAKVEEPETFYGYYTMDVSKDGSTYGMLSVNGYSGDVWYHSWHGKFISMVEYD